MDRSRKMKNIVTPFAVLLPLLLCGPGTAGATAQPPWADAALVADVRAWAAEAESRGKGFLVERWERVLAALGHGEHADPMTAGEANAFVSQGYGAKWHPVWEALVAREAWTPEVAVEVTETETETEPEPEPPLPQDAVTVEEVAAIRDGFLAIGNAGAAARWNGIVLALEGADGGVTVPELEAWLADAERHGWAKGREYLPRAIATLKALAALQAWREAQEAGPTPAVQPVQEVQAVPQNAPMLSNGKVPVRHFAGRFLLSSNLHVTPHANGQLSIDLFGERTAWLCARDVTNGCTLPPDTWNSGVEGSDDMPVHGGPQLGAHPHNNKPNAGARFEWTARYNGAPSRQRHTTKFTHIVDARDNDGDGTIDDDDYSRVGHKFVNDAGDEQTATWCDNNRDDCWVEMTSSKTEHVYGESRALLKDGWTFAVGWDNPWPSNGIEETTVRTGTELERWYVAAKHDGGDGWRAFGYWTASEFRVEERGSYMGEPRWIARQSRSGVVGSRAGGVFVAGSDPADDVSGVGGTARYEGYAAGLMGWSEDSRARMTTFRDAPTYFTADFDAMSIDGEIHVGDLDGRSSDIPSPTVDVPTGANFRHPDSETARGLERWDAIGPDVLVFTGGRIGADGAITVGCPREAGCNFRERSYVDEIGVTQTYELPLREFAHGSIGSSNRKPGGRPAGHPVTLEDSFLRGEFHQPGNGAPGSMMGTFSLFGGTGPDDTTWAMDGAFVADKR